MSNLEEGHYQFILRVTDSIGQSSNTSVYVYVQKPNLSAPKGMVVHSLTVPYYNTSYINQNNSQNTGVCLASVLHSRNQRNIIDVGAIIAVHMNNLV